MLVAACSKPEQGAGTVIQNPADGGASVDEQGQEVASPVDEMLAQIPPDATIREVATALASACDMLSADYAEREGQGGSNVCSDDSYYYDENWDLRGESGFQDIIEQVRQLCTSMLSVSAEEISGVGVRSTTDSSSSLSCDLRAGSRYSYAGIAIAFNRTSARPSCDTYNGFYDRCEIVGEDRLEASRTYDDSGAQFRIDGSQFVVAADFTGPSGEVEASMSEVVSLVSECYNWISNQI